MLWCAELFICLRKKCLVKFLPIFVVLEMESRVSGMLSKCFPTYLYSQ